MKIDGHQIPDTLCDQIVSEAQARYGLITPCIGRESIDECFMVDRGYLMLWINTQDKSTHIVRASIQTEEIL